MLYSPSGGLHFPSWFSSCCQVVYAELYNLSTNTSVYTFIVITMLRHLTHCRQVIFMPIINTLTHFLKSMMILCPLKVIYKFIFLFISEHIFGPLILHLWMYILKLITSYSIRCQRIVFRKSMSVGLPITTFNLISCKEKFSI